MYENKQDKKTKDEHFQKHPALADSFKYSTSQIKDDFD